MTTGRYNIAKTQTLMRTCTCVLETYVRMDTTINIARLLIETPWRVAPFARHVCHICPLPPNDSY